MLSPLQRTFLVIAALLFTVSAAATIAWSDSMSAMGGRSMMWMRMPGRTWPGTAASFLAMWDVMMVAMMLPSLLLPLWRYHQLVGRTGETCLVGIGYFGTWTAFGVIAFPVGVVLAQMPAPARVAPVVVGSVILLAGMLQFSPRRAHHLACCRALPAEARKAWRHGIRLGLHCGYCCFGPMAVLQIVGLMDLRAMVMATAIITIERLAPSVAHAIGVGAIGAGLFLIVRAAGLG